MGTRLHMDKYGLTQRQLACVSAKNHNNSVHNPYAQYQKPFTVEEVLAAPLIAYPLTLPMCSPVGDGASALIICSREYVKKLGVSKPVKILATVLRAHGIYLHEGAAALGFLLLFLLVFSLASGLGLWRSSPDRVSGFLPPGRGRYLRRAGTFRSRRQAAH